jgi:PAS domain S-box-containing protein
VLAGEAGSSERSKTMPDGSVRHVLGHHLPRFGADGGIDGLYVVLIDITDRKTSEAALQESQAKASRLALVASRTSNSVMITDAGGRIEWVNDGFTRLTGFSMEEAAGRIPAKFLHGPDTRRETAEAIRRAIVAGGSINTEILHYTRDGRPQWVSTDIEPIRDALGRLSNFVILESDITGRKASEKMLREAKEVAESVSRAKSEFVANMSHEIRTPMNGVLGMTELLLDTELTDGQRRYAKNIRNSADALLNIINDILDFSKIEAGKMELDPVDFDVRELTEEVAEMAAGRAHAKGIELLCRIDENVPAAVKGDAGRLRQVLTNLVGNAVKFTERGEVLIEVRATGEVAADGASRLEFSIVDTGIGISEEALARLFTAFTQADGSTTRRFGGTGLGLVISRQLVRLMGGDIEVESMPDHGSRFWFVMTMGAAETAVAQWVTRDDLRGLGVLIVEDNRTNSDILVHHATTWGMRATAVGSAEDALAAVAAPDGRAFDLALIDWKLPGMSGIDLARTLRASTGAAPARMILLTSMTASNLAQAARDAGFAAHLCKPLRREELYRTIARALGVAGPAAEPVDACAGAQMRAAGGHVLLVEDNQVNQDIGAAMLASLGTSADIANNGIEAVALFGRNSYDLILMDCQMPEMDGFAATAEIREREAASSAKRTPIVALTANAMQGDRERCLAAGMDDYLAKPFSKMQLAAMIGRWIGGMAGAAPGKPAAVTPAAAARGAGCAPGESGIKDAERVEERDPVLDQRALANIRALERPGTPSLLERVIERYIGDAAKLCGQMRGASAAGDAQALARAAHTLKSASANVGAGGAAELCKALETGSRAGETEFAAALLNRLEPELDRVASALRQEIAVAA